MDYFDAFDEVFSTIDAFVQQHGHPPHDVAVSPTLYTWLAELQRESNFVHGIKNLDMVFLETAYGPIHIVIDETLSAYDIVLE